ncbi:hypothetical protein [Agrobacterium tumefaciens]|uniref:hypothetical protein n=1 Tax=Agrobacterium tumefaciens TaxID=358 RepID=UPI0021D11D38|nr:hypothetical protein [Agrobacterium tumefaciens]UXS01612.1 hypothetical protein FY156_09090 [Agrobacterium tumefaciens]
MNTYRFQAGRSVVTVQATTEKEAAAKASEKLTHLAAKFFVRPPADGWTLQQIEAP